MNLTEVVFCLIFIFPFSILMVNTVVNDIREYRKIYKK